VIDFCSTYKHGGQYPLKILFIGGTGFVGRHMVQHAIDAGHQITLFNRNQTDASVFSEVERLVGDRTKSLDLLQGRSWDAVVDINGYLPDVVSASLSQLQNSVGRYVFISTGSVYAINNQIRLDEHAPLLSTANLNPADYAGVAYGGLKILCEQNVEKVFGNRSTVLRLGVVAGAYDPTDRATYWVDRIGQGGNVAIPAKKQGRLQFVDVNDVASFALVAIENEIGGIYNVCGEAIRWDNWIDACCQATESQAHCHWLDDYEWVAEQRPETRRPFGAFPLVQLRDKPILFDSEKAKAQGLVYRSPKETAAAIWA
jgi:2'-hydroxyisoflavone reductase